MEPLTDRDLNRATLARQHLLGRVDRDPLEIVDLLAGMQAQERPAPAVGLWTRLDGFERRALQELYRERKAVRATGMRSTIHTVTAEQFLAFRALWQPVLTRVWRGLQPGGRDVPVEEVVPVARELLAQTPLTLAELREELAQRFPANEPPALVLCARMELPVVLVPGDEPWDYSAAAPYTLCEEWLGAEPEPEPDRAALVRAHLRAFGPATVKDITKWSGVTKLVPVVKAMGDELVRFTHDDGRELLDLPDAPRPGPDVDAPARFLGHYDNIALAYDDRSRFVTDEYRAAVRAAAPPVYGPMYTSPALFLLDGMIAGAWRVATPRKSQATLELIPARKLKPRELAELRDEGERLLTFWAPDSTDRTITLLA